MYSFTWQNSLPTIFDVFRLLPTTKTMASAMYVMSHGLQTS